MKNFALGLIFGAFIVYQYYDNAQVESDVKQIKKDNIVAEEIKQETAEAIKTNTVIQTVIKWKDKPVHVPRDLTDDEIDSLCVNRAVPADIMQSIRSEASRAQQRINNL